MKRSEFHVVIVGRPNVGKSSLFNSLIGFRRAIVLDMPGTTRDQVSEKKNIGTAVVRITDSLGILEAKDREELTPMVTDADCVLFVVDAKQGSTPLDREIAIWLKKLKRPTMLCVNKCDVKNIYDPESFFALTMDTSLLISAEHGTNVEAVRQWILKEKKHEETGLAPDEKPPLTLALIGRPNTGKSTLMNRLCQSAISKVSPEPLTTRDSVSFELVHKDQIIRLLDTAGIRRPRSKKERVEVLSIASSKRSIEEADVTFLCLSAKEGVTDQDMRLLNLLKEEGKPAGVLLNFWDTLTREERRNFWDYCDFTAALESFPTVMISGLRGENVDKLLPLAVKLGARAENRISTSDLNRLVERIKIKNPPPSHGTGYFNILYASQVQAKPPTFVFFVNRKQSVSDSYRRYLEKQLQESLSLKGQAIRLYFKAARSNRRPQ